MRRVFRWRQGTRCKCSHRRMSCAVCGVLRCLYCNPETTPCREVTP